MSTITIIDNDYAILMYHPDTQIVHHPFYKPISGQEFRGVLDEGAALLKKHSACKWLSDDRTTAPYPMRTLSGRRQISFCERLLLGGNFGRW
jgi:hypothetical protein